MYLGLHVCYCVTYHPRSDKCMGDEVQGKCNASGLHGARINTSDSLVAVKEAINDNENYWTGLR